MNLVLHNLRSESAVLISNVLELAGAIYERSPVVLMIVLNDTLRQVLDFIPHPTGSNRRILSEELCYCLFSGKKCASGIVPFVIYQPRASIVVAGAHDA